MKPLRIIGGVTAAVAGPVEEGVVVFSGVEEALDGELEEDDVCVLFGDGFAGEDGGGTG